MLKESLISPVDVYTGFIQGSYDLQALGDAKVYVELLANRRDSDQTTYRQAILDYREGSPMIPPELAFASFGGDQGTSDGENIGVRAFIGFGNDKNGQTVDYLKPTVGLKGDLTFLPDWKYDAYVSYAKSDAEYRQQSFLIDKLTYASGIVAAPAGTDASLVRNGQTCSVNITNPEEKCIPYPYLTPAVIGGELPNDFKDYIFRNIVGNTIYEETVWSAAFDGPLFTLPAGKVQAVLGLEHREATLDDMPDDNSASGNLYNLTVALPTKGEDSVSELFTEIEVPLIADLPFAKELTVNGSYRYTDYDSYGSDTTYKAGIVYSPTSWLSIRGTTGTSFRAPALSEQFQGASSGFLSATNDPCNEYGVSDNAIRAANCAKELPGQPEYQNTQGIETFDIGGAGTGLEAETSRNTTYGIILQPDLGDDTKLSIAFDYFDIEIENGVDQAGTTNILGLCYDDPNFREGGGYCNLVTRDSTGQLSVSNAYTNLSTQVSRGVDFETEFSHNMGPGQFSAHATLTRYYSQAQKLFETDPLDELNGAIEYPEWSGTATISYSLNMWRLSYGLEWLGAMDSYKIEEEDPETSLYDLETERYLEHRVSLRYQADTWEGTFGVRNLTNELPPFVSSQKVDRVGNAPLYSGYDYAGRELFLNLQYKFN